MTARTDSDFLIKTHEKIGLFSNPSFNRHLLRRLYHMRLDCFNPYKDLCSLIESILQDLKLYASGILYHSRIFMYILLLSDPYKYVVTTFVKCIYKLSVTTKLIKNLNVIAFTTREYVSS
jgi:hypothetical protein